MTRTFRLERRLTRDAIATREIVGLVALLGVALAIAVRVAAR